MIKGMNACMPVAISRNFTMTSIMVRYILKALDIEFVAPGTGHDRRRLVILTGAYLMINFGYFLQMNGGLRVDADHFCQYIEVGKNNG